MKKKLKHAERFDLLNITWEWIRLGQDREVILNMIAREKEKRRKTQSHSKSAMIKS